MNSVMILEEEKTKLKTKQLSSVSQSMDEWICSSELQGIKFKGTLDIHL